MVQDKRSEALKSSTSYRNDTHEQLTCAQAPSNGANYNLSTGSYDEDGERLKTRMPYHQATSVTDGAAHEHKEVAPFRATNRGLRHDAVDEQCSSRAKMFDPVKDCSGPNTTQADVSGYLPARHNSSRHGHSKASASTSTGLHLSHRNHPYGQARESPYRVRNSGPRGDGLPLFDQSHGIGLGYQGNASMDLLSSPQSQAIASVYQVNASMSPQPIQVGHPHDQVQHYRHYRPMYEDTSILYPHLRDPSGHFGLQSVTKGAALTGMQPRQAANLHDHAQESGQQNIGIESRMPAAIASHELVHSRQSPSLAIANMSTQKIPGLQRANHHQHQNFFPNMSQAIEMAQYAERVDPRTNREEAIHAYERACALLQDVIIRSSSFEERTECNTARNVYQARLDVLLRESAASPSNTPPGQNDEQDDDEQAGGKPQYSLYEDWALCRKMEEGLSWQEVAETSLFKGRRKHRSLSQRKHTIGKMGPKYHEAEEPWTEADNKKLCALGDAGKSLGDIHRKFRSRNAERCLDRYFQLKGIHLTGSSHARTSLQARHAPASGSRSPESMQDPSSVARHSVYGVHPGASISETGSHGQSIDSALQQTHQRPIAFSQNIPSALTLKSHPSEASSPSSPFASAGPLSCSTGSLFSNNAASPRPFATQSQGPPEPLRRLERQGVPHSTPPYSSALSRPQDPDHRRIILPPPSPYPSAPGAMGDNVSGRTASYGALANASPESPFAAWHPRLSNSLSNLSSTAANSPNNPTSPTSSLSTPRTMTSPYGSRDSLDTHSVAAKKGRKPG